MASAVKTLAVGIKVYVREGEPLPAALKRFRRLLYSRERRATARIPPAGKTTFWYYQKPGDLKRQKEHRDVIRKRHNLNARI